MYKWQEGPRIVNTTDDWYLMIRFFICFFVGLNAWKSTGGKIQSTAFITQLSELLCFIFEACDNWVVMHYQNRKKSDKLSMCMENLTWEGRMMVGGCWVFSRIFTCILTLFIPTSEVISIRKKCWFLLEFCQNFQIMWATSMQRVTWVIRPINSVYLRYLEVLLMEETLHHLGSIKENHSTGAGFLNHQQ